MSDEPRAVVESLFTRLERAWNAGDGSAYCEPFTDNADFVDIRGVHHATRAAIGAGHQAIFESIYKHSVVSYAVTDARELVRGCVVGHSSGVLNVPHGPFAGTHHATMTAVATSDGTHWHIAAFHNTLVAQ